MSKVSNSIKMKDIPHEDRPRERIIKWGPEGLTNSELLAVVLGTGLRDENVVQMSTRLISEFKGLDKVLEAGIGELRQVKGIGYAKAAKLIALSELINRYRSHTSKEKIRISSPEIVFNLFGEKMRSLKQEIVKILVLNTKKEILYESDVSKGTNNSSLIHPREIFTEAIRNGGDSIIVIHNHPSGDPKESKNDINVTTRLKECGKLLGIELVDHIIIGDREYISLKEKGLV